MQKKASSKIKQKQMQTKMLEEQTKRMQEKLLALRQQVEEQKKLKQSSNHQSTLSRWKKVSNSNAPLKDYAKQVLADRKEAMNKFGINQKKIFGSKSFEPALTKLKFEKQEQEEKDLSKIPKFEATSNFGDGSTKQLPIQSIQNNFFKAKINAAELIRRKSMSEFLEQNFLHQYIPVLQSNGILELEDLYHLSRDRMGEMGIKPGHQAKIIKKVKEELENPSSPRKQDKQLQKVEESKAVSFGYGQGDVNDYAELNEYDHAKKTQDTHPRQQEDQEKGNYEQIQGNSSGQQQQQQQEYDDMVILTNPQMFQFSVQTAAGSNLSEETKEFNCFQCYRKWKEEGVASSDGRRFCSEQCRNKYLKFMQKTCPECECEFFKFEGYFEEGLWFCSIKCSPNRQKIEGMFLQWRSAGQ